MALTKITTSVVAVNSLTAANIADNSIDATKIANNQILARHIAAGALSDQIADNSIGISELNVSDGSSGQFLKTDGSGTLSFATVSGTTINNNADNRVITGSGTANTLEGESKFTFDGSSLVVEPTTATGLSYAVDGTNSFINFEANSVAASVQLYAGQSSGGYFSIGTKDSGGTLAARMRVTSTGVGIGTTSPATELQVGDYTDNLEQITIATASDQTGRINFYNNNNTEGASIRVIGGGNGAKMYFANRYDSDTDRVTIDLVNGYLGVGTTSPQNTLHVHTGSTDSRMQFTNASSGSTYSDGLWVGHDNTQAYFMHRENLPITFWTNTAERMRITSTGNVGIGVSDPDALLEVRGSSRFAQENAAWSFDDTGNGRIGFWKKAGLYPYLVSATGTPMLFGVTNTSNITSNVSSSTVSESMRILADRGICMNVTGRNNGAPEVLNIYNAGSGGGYGINIKCIGSSGGTMLRFNTAGNIVGQIYTSSSATTYATSSDYRLKENVSYTWDATARLKQLKPARFNFIADADTTVDGFLAHEVSSIVPEAIKGEKDGEEMQCIDHSKLVPLLVKTIQELEARIATLEG